MGRSPPPRRLPALGWLALGGCCVGGFATAQVLPETGGGAGVTVQPRVATPPAPISNPIWTVTPAIALQEEWTDNAVPSGGTRQQSSFITAINPSLAITADSARLNGTLSYAPQIYYYMPATSQNRADQNLDAFGHVTLVPDQLFLDLRGFGAVSSLNGGAAPGEATTLSKQNSVQNYSFSLTPYAVHRFGGWGTLQIGTALSETIQQSLGGTPLVGSANASQNLRSLQETAEFTSGENFGRWSNDVRVTLGQNDGIGPLAGARRDDAAWQAGYAITHEIVALASIGYEDIKYHATGGTDGFHVNDATWAFGVKLLPNPDSAITLLYGHRDGATSVSLNASYAPTARIQVFARYSTGISTAAEDLQASLTGAQLDPLGHPVDAITQAPLQLTNNFFASSGDVFLDHSLSVTAAWQLDRDSLQATINREQRTPVGAQSAASVEGANTGIYGSLAWQHQVSESLTTNAFMQYGVSQTGSGAQASTSNLIEASVSMSYAISETLTGTFQYSYERIGPSSGGSVHTSAQTTNLFVLGLRKTF